MTDAMPEDPLEQRRARIAVLRRLNSALPKERRHAIPPLHDPAHQSSGRDTAAAVETLLAMSRADYAERVCGDLSADKDDAWQLYLHPHLVQFTHAVLIRKYKMVCRLASETRESASSPVARRRWAFLTMLESRIQQTEAALPDTVMTSDRNTARRLFAAIQAHRRALTANGVQPEAWDLALWKAVDNLPRGEEQ